MVVVFTNGCFDIVHPGHIDLLSRARALGDRLIVGINSDASVARIKGSGRPFMDQESRKAVLLGLKPVDEVIIFDESTPEKLIETVRPDVLVKGGDWEASEIIGADQVRASGGRVLSLPLIDGFSSSSIVNKIRSSLDPRASATKAQPTDSFAEHIQTVENVAAHLGESINACSELIVKTFKQGKKVLICGNGGSAADSQHLAAEFVSRYESDRRSLPAIALTTDTSALTAIANDYDFESIFARQVESLATENDCLIAISTSGNSKNVIAAVMQARRNGCKVIGMTGINGKKLASLCDECLMVPVSRTARIQEVHILVAHIWCEAVDNAFSN